MHIQSAHRFAGVAALFVTIAVAGCGRADGVRPQAPTPDVSVIAVRPENVPVSIQLPGRTSPFLIAQVRARVDGIVQKRVFQEGADVKANELLYQIDPAPYQAALNSAQAALLKAQANLSNAEAQLARYKILVGGNAVSKQVFDNAVAAQQQAAADVAAAKATVETAKINLGYTRVTTPIAGRSGVSQVTPGAYVQSSAATLMTTVQQIDPIYVDLQQSSVEGLKLRQALANGKLKSGSSNPANVTLTLEDGTKYPLPGTLEFINSTVDQATGSVAIRARFANPDRILLPGMFVRAQIEQGTKEKVIPVPVAAVSHDPSGNAVVLVVGEDHKVSQRVVQANDIVGGNWLVEAGLNRGEQVVVSGGQKVQLGMLVNPRKEQPPVAMADISTTSVSTQPNHNAALSPSK